MASKTVELQGQGHSSIAFTSSAMMDTRYSFTAQFLAGAASLARSANIIEAKEVNSVTEQDRVDHRAYVVGAIMQASAALEAEIWEVLAHGPSHHLGSDRTNHAAQEFLEPLVKLIDKKSVVAKYDLVLHFLRLHRLDPRSQPAQDVSLRDKLSDEVVHYKPKWDPKAQPAQDASFLVKLRNEIVHYKSKWGRKMEMEEETKKLLESFRQKRHPRPPFIVSGMNFFPHEILSATCAAWAVDTAVAFLDMFYGQLGVASPIESQRASFNPR